MGISIGFNVIGLVVFVILVMDFVPIIFHNAAGVQLARVMDTTVTRDWNGVAALTADTFFAWKIYGPDHEFKADFPPFIESVQIIPLD